jgi:hypothetical protein
MGTAQSYEQLDTNEPTKTAQTHISLRSVAVAITEPTRTSSAQTHSDKSINAPNERNPESFVCDSSAN